MTIQDRIATKDMDLKRWPIVDKPQRNNPVPSVKTLIMILDPICLWCRKRPSTTVDHVQPRARGGTNSLTNLVGSCSTCNRVKGHYMPNELGWKIKLPLRAYPLSAPRVRMRDQIDAPHRRPRASDPTWEREEDQNAASPITECA